MMAVSLEPVAQMLPSGSQKSWPPFYSAVSLLGGRGNSPVSARLRPRQEAAERAELGESGPAAPPPSPTGAGLQPSHPIEEPLAPGAVLTDQGPLGGADAKPPSLHFAAWLRAT